MNESVSTLESVAWLQGRLRVAARRYLRVEVSVFIVNAVALAALGFGVYFLADFLVRFPRSVRILLSAGLTAAGLVWAARVARRWIVPYRTLDATARAVELAGENSGGHSHSMIVSALEFGERPAIPGAIAFKNIVIQAAQRQARDPARVALYAAAHIRLMRKLGATALIVAIGLAAVWPRTCIFSRRLLGLSTAYPTATRIITGLWPRVAPARVDYPVELSVEGRVPVSGLLTVRRHGRRSFSVPLKSQTNGTFSATIQAPEQSFSFTCALGDAETEPFTVAVHTPPLARKVTLTVTPPAYTGLPGREESSDSVTVPEGSAVAFKIEPDSQVVVCGLEGEGRRIECKSDEQGNWRGGGVFTDSWNYAVAMTNAAGVGIVAASPRCVNIARDTPPTIELHTPKPNSAVAPIGLLVFDFVAHDDYGLTEAGVSYEVYERRDNTDVLVKKDSFRAAAAPAGREAGVRITKTVAGLGLTPGQRMVVRGYAIDNRPPPGAQRAESDQAEIAVVPPEELRRMIETELQQVGGLLLKFSEDEQRQSEALRQRLATEKRVKP